MDHQSMTLAANDNQGFPSLRVYQLITSGKYTGYWQSVKSARDLLPPHDGRIELSVDAADSFATADSILRHHYIRSLIGRVGDEFPGDDSLCLTEVTLQQSSRNFWKLRAVYESTLCMGRGE